jgi:adenylate kinase family enzyme
MALITLPEIEALGRRIMILGPSNSGKSTLAVAIAEKLGLAAVHLDQLRHLPHTNWEERPDKDFVALHDAAILGPEWVIEGGYSKVMEQRLQRATGILVITDTLPRRYRRYFYRSIFQKRRAGGLAGEQDSVTWKMIRWLWKTRDAVGKYQKVAETSGLPHHLVMNQRQLQALYRAWGLTFPV